MRIRFDVEDLCVGMFVCELDCPWLDTPFLLQCFLIEEPGQISELGKYCHHVFVDPSMSTIPVGTPQERVATRRLMTGKGAAGAGPEGEEIAADHSILELEDSPVTNTPIGRMLAKLRIEYPSQASVEEELPVAREIHQRASEAVHALFDRIMAGGVMDGKALHETIDEITDSVIRSPDALLLLTYLRQKSQYAYDHAISVSVHLLAFGRHIGLPKSQLHVLGSAGILLDTGMSRLSGEILHKKGRLTEQEFETMKTHVAFGLDFVHNSPDISPQVGEILALHHERENGCGYPLGLKEREIGILGKMAAIVDCYAALISQRPYAQPMPSFEALQMLYNWRGTFYHADMVEQFIQCLGPYPVGGLVELNTGEVAVVLEHNRIRRLKPRVMVVLDAGKKPLSSPVMLDLINDPTAFNDHPYRIERSLPDGAYGTDLTDFYL